MLTIPTPVTSYPPPSSLPRWFWVAGTWGDSLAGLGNAQALAKGKQFRLLHYGQDPKVADWLREQPGVRELRHLPAPTKAAYLDQVANMPTDPARRWEWLRRLLPDRRYHPEGIWPAHVDFTLQEQLPVHLPKLAPLPIGVRTWARTFRRCGTGKTILFQPRSESSCQWSGHWPHWQAAVQWLLRETDWKLWLCGHGYDAQLFGTHPRLLNLIGKTASMLHVFALAEEADLTLTTSNALSLYCAARNLPAVACCNLTHRFPDQFFSRFIKKGGVSLVENWEGMDRFLSVSSELMSDTISTGEKTYGHNHLRTLRESERAN